MSFGERKVHGFEVSTFRIINPGHAEKSGEKSDATEKKDCVAWNDGET